MIAQVEQERKMATLRDVEQFIRQSQGRKFQEAIYVELAGSHDAAALLRQLLYWTPRATANDGWIYKTRVEIESEIGLRRHRFEAARAALVVRGLVACELRWNRGARMTVMHYRVESAALFEALGAIICGDTVHGEFPPIDKDRLQESSITDCRNPASPNAENQHDRLQESRLASLAYPDFNPVLQSRTAVAGESAAAAHQPAHLPGEIVEDEKPRKVRGNRRGLDAVWEKIGAVVWESQPVVIDEDGDKTKNGDSLPPSSALPPSQAEKDLTAEAQREQREEGNEEVAAAMRDEIVSAFRAAFAVQPVISERFAGEMLRHAARLRSAGIKPREVTELVRRKIAAGKTWYRLANVVEDMHEIIGGGREVERDGSYYVSGEYAAWISH